jgi:hypothetical protein
LTWEETPGTLALGFVLGAPYAIAFYASMQKGPSSQAPLLLAATPLSFAASIAALSGVTLVLLPASVFLGVGLFRTWGDWQAGLIAQAFAIVGVAAGVTAIVASFVVLFLHQDPRSYRGGSTSDIVTLIEALASFGLLSFGLVVLAVVSSYSGRHTNHARGLR